MVKKNKMREEKYSNFTEGYGRALMLVPVIAIYGIYSLYKFSKRDKKNIQVFSGFIGTLILVGKRKKLMNKKPTGKARPSKGVIQAK